ncbi:MAG TPA: hypothetical protein VFT63_03155 [bacterium]|nr:hypothetical protein [bacterium]
MQTSLARGLGALALTIVVGSCASARVSPPPAKPDVDLTIDVNVITEGQLWDAADRLTPFWDRGGRPQNRNCALGPMGGCLGRINGIRDTLLGPNSVKANGTIVAWLENLGAPGGGADRGAEQKYGTEMEGPRRKRYYMIGLPNGPDRWKWEIRVAIQGSTDPSQKVREGEFITCDDSYPDHPTGTKATFWWCPARGVGSGTIARMARIVPQSFNPLDPGWLDCEQGCCTAGQ